ncbi:MAG: helix-hairpin-helix domain-containing protein [Ginsengibacter sp.]|jgi:competence ComEA-like helix-hairpin-helix protein
MWKQFAKDYFVFTRKERWGIISIVSFIILFMVLPFLYPLFVKNEKVDSAEFANEIAQLKIDSSGEKSFAKKFDNEYQNDYSLPPSYNSIKAELFPFDPNTATLQDWVKLGVREKTAITIQKYISKGGKFYKPEDIKKIWGLNKNDAERLLPYVSIKNKPNEYHQFEKKDYPKSLVSYVPRTIQKVEINLADTTAYIALPGIGSKLSQRIISFRDKLGGFHSIDQVSETFLLPDSTFQKIKPYLILNNAVVKKININTASIDEMKSHPYIRYYVANAIFQYRQQHGAFNSIEQIKKIMIVTDEIYAKAEPYLAL